MRNRPVFGVLFFLLCVAAFVAPGLSWARDDLVVGFFAFEPHAMRGESGEPSGAAVEYLSKHIAPHMDASVLIQGPIPFSRLMFRFEEGWYDAVLLLARTRERQGRFVYPPEPFGFMRPALLVRSGALAGGLTRPEQVDGMRIGFVQGAWIVPFLRRSKARFDLIAGGYATEKNLRKFVQGRVDGVFSPDRASIVYGAGKAGVERFRVVDVPGEKVGLFTVFHPDVPDAVVRDYARALERARSQVDYEAVLDGYLRPSESSGPDSSQP